MSSGFCCPLSVIQMVQDDTDTYGRWFYVVVPFVFVLFEPIYNLDSKKTLDDDEKETMCPEKAVNFTSGKTNGFISY